MTVWTRLNSPYTLARGPLGTSPAYLFPDLHKKAWWLPFLKHSYLSTCSQAPSGGCNGPAREQLEYLSLTPDPCWLGCPWGFYGPFRVPLQADEWGDAGAWVRMLSASKRSCPSGPQVSTVWARKWEGHWQVCLLQCSPQVGRDQVWIRRSNEPRAEGTSMKVGGERVADKGGQWGRQGSPSGKHRLWISLPRGLQSPWTRPHALSALSARPKQLLFMMSVRFCLSLQLLSIHKLPNLFLPKLVRSSICSWPPAEPQLKHSLSPQ